MQFAKSDELAVSLGLAAMGVGGRGLLEISFCISLSGLALSQQ